LQFLQIDLAQFAANTVQIANKQPTPKIRIVADGAQRYSPAPSTPAGAFPTSFRRRVVMSRRLFLLRLTRAGLLASLGPLAPSCGTLIHPERVGQPRMGRIDPAVAILDGLGLLLFLIPGIIAFVVDFSTGAIFLPPEYIGDANLKPEADGLVKLSIDRDRMSRKAIEQAVSAASRQTIRLDPGHYRAERLESLHDHESVANHLAAIESDRRTEVIFRCQSP
jgi:hypothetical protein